MQATVSNSQHRFSGASLQEVNINKTLLLWCASSGMGKNHGRANQSLIVLTLSDLRQGYWMGLEAWRKTKGIASIDLRRPGCGSTGLCSLKTQAALMHLWGVQYTCSSCPAGCLGVMWETVCLEQAMELMPQPTQQRLLLEGTGLASQA